MHSQIHVSLVYSLQPRQFEELFLHVELGTTIAQAVQSSGITHCMDAPMLQSLSLGVWGKKVSSDYVLQPNDRIELYRPLAVDPKVARRERFAKQGSRRAGLFAKRRAGAKAGY